MADIVRWDPWGELDTMRRTVDRLFEEGLPRPWRIGSWGAGEAYCPMDVYETEGEVAVKMSLPGVKPEDVDISITGDTLTIKGEVRAEEEEKHRNYYRQERRIGTFARTLTLPVEVEPDKAEADFEHGVLTLHLPKAEAAKPRSIKVHAKDVIEGEKK